MREKYLSVCLEKPFFMQIVNASDTQLIIYTIKIISTLLLHIQSMIKFDPIACNYSNQSIGQI